MNSTLNTNDKIPTSTTYCVPIPDINSPPTAVPIVVPKLTDAKIVRLRNQELLELLMKSSIG